MTGEKTKQALHHVIGGSEQRFLLNAVEPQPMKVMFESGLVSWLGEQKFCGDLDEDLALAWQMLARSADRSADT